MRLPPNSSAATARLIPGAAAQDRRDAQQQLFQVKRFGQVVVAAGLEAAHAVLGGALHRQEQHGRLDAVAAQLRAELDPVHARHHDVEDGEIVWLGAQARESRSAVVRDVGAVALGLEVLADAGREVLFVVDDEYARRSLHCAAPPASASTPSRRVPGPRLRRARCRPRARPSASRYRGRAPCPASRGAARRRADGISRRSSPAPRAESPGRRR